MPARHPIRALLFDKDGTLLDFDATWGPATGNVMRAFANGDAAAFQRLVEVNHYDLAAGRLKPSSPMIAGSHADYGPDWAKALGIADDAAFYARLDQMFTEEGLKNLKAAAPLIPLFERFKAKNLPMGIATNDAELAARRQAEALGLTSYLSYFAGYDSGHGRKPGPGMVQAFIRQTGLPAEQVAMIGDTAHDLHAARAAGALAVAVLTGPEGQAARPQLEPHADLVLDDLAALADYIGA